MIDFMVDYGVSNACVAAGLAMVAWSVQRWTQRAGVAHLLWLLVLVKLVTPPLFNVPLLDLSRTEEFAEVSADATAGAALQSVEASLLDVSSSEGLSFSQLTEYLVGFWAVASIGLLAWSLITIYRFHRILGRTIAKPSAESLRLTSALSKKFGLRHPPEVLLTTAAISPMVWWIGVGRARIVLPETLVRELPQDKLRLIVAHELGHIARGDHFVRWLELLCTALFWWNPVMWWARNGLRFNEELCCDSLVMNTLEAHEEKYADSLLCVVECLANPGIRPPALASGVTSGGSLERRLRMIISKAPHGAAPRWVQAGILLCALGILPLGLAEAQVNGVKGKQEVPTEKQKLAAELAKLRYETDVIAIKTAVLEGKLTNAEAKKKLELLRRRAVVKGSIKSKPDARRSMEKMKARIDAAVAAGKITAAEGREKLDIYARKMAEKEARVANGRAKREVELKRLEEVLQKLKDAVDSGKLTHEEAELKRRYFEEKLKVDSSKDDGHKNGRRK